MWTKELEGNEEAVPWWPSGYDSGLSLLWSGNMTPQVMCSVARKREKGGGNEKMETESRHRLSRGMAT